MKNQLILSGDLSFVFYDFETVQEPVDGGSENEKVHRVIAAHARLVCRGCTDIKQPNCSTCTTRYWTGVDSIEKISEWLFTQSKTVAFAHNSKGFDAQFVLDYIYRKGTQIPKVYVLFF